MYIRVPVIKVKDVHSGREHIVGTNSHDSLRLDENGNICYYNLQNGEGTGCNDSEYEFVAEQSHPV